MGYVYFEGGLPGVESLGPAGTTNFMEAEKYFNKAKQLNVAAVWIGPPKEFTDRKDKKLNLSKPVENAGVGKVEASAGAGLTSTLWDYAPQIAIGALAVAFAYDYYRRSSSK